MTRTSANIPRGDPAGRFLRQRLTSVLLLPLTAFAIGLGIWLVGADYAATIDALGHPLIGLLLFVFVTLVAYHMSLGIIDIVEDYVHARIAHRLAILSSVAYSVIVVAVSGYAIAKLSFGE